ncbi:hypothetical protein GCM10009760_21200 [Kitasatospora kazusensis]|uniref:phosphoribosylglycinamide formyltransferase 1 n=1 Tax=Kitasatospora kazusensis TaxID=407974 RepID=A0ABN2ZAB6_9ACTN
MIRVALLSSDEPHARYLEALLAQRFDVRCVVVERGAAKRRRLLTRRRYRDWTAGLYHLARRRLLSRTAYRARYFALAPGASPATCGHTLTDDINAPIVAERLRRAKPDVTVVLNTSIIRTEVLRAAGDTVLNIHGGYLPDYRGRQTMFFPLYENRLDRLGSTIHFVTEKLDAGDIVEVVPVPVRDSDNDETLYCRAERRAIHRLCELLDRLAEGHSLPRAPQDGSGSVYRDRDRTPRHELAVFLKRTLTKGGLANRPLTKGPLTKGPLAKRSLAKLILAACR